jgi:hypothetical protein
MAKNLFDLIDDADAAERPKVPQKDCKHPREEKTFTTWPEFPNDERMTWTCESCGKIRGRC